MSPGQEFLKKFHDGEASGLFASAYHGGPRSDAQMRAELEALHQKEGAKRAPKPAPTQQNVGFSVGELARVRGWLENHLYDKPSSARHAISEIAGDLQISEASVQKCLSRLQEDYDHGSLRGAPSFR